MSRRRTSRRWSPTAAGARIVLAIIAVGLGYVAVMQSLAVVIQSQLPGEAHALAPGNGVITARLASELSGPEATPKDRRRADRLARLALRQDPTALDAVVALGLDAQIRGDTASARRLFAYAEALSRRNLQTQIWAIGDNIARSDVPAVLFHYDVALRTSEDASALLFPVLATAITDPVIRTALVKTLARRPDWAGSFIDYLVTNGADPEATAALFKALLHRDISIPDGDSAALINALIQANKVDQAWGYYMVIRPGANRHLSRDPDFSNGTDAPSPFDWVPINVGSISAAIQRNGNGAGVLTFTAPPSVGGQIVDQLEMLAPGDYILEGRSEDIRQPDDSRPYWSLSCRDGRALGRVDVPNSAVANGHFGGRFSIPTDCSVQVLALNIRPSTNVSGVTGQIDRALLRPAG